MKMLTRDDLAALIDVDRLRSLFGDGKAAAAGLVRQKEEESMKGIKKIVKTTLIVMAVVACVCGIAYAIYKYLVPDYDDEFDDEFDDAFDDDDLFDDDDKDEEKDDNEEADENVDEKVNDEKKD